MHHLVRFVVVVFLGFAMISCTVEDTMLHDWLLLFWFGRVCACAYNANRFMFQILVHFEFSQSIRTSVYCIYIFYGNVCLYIILIVPSDRCWWWCWCWCCCRFLLLLFPSRCFMWFCNGALRANKMAYSLIWLMWSAHVYPIHGWNDGLASYMNYSCGNGVCIYLDIHMWIYGSIFANLWMQNQYYQ